MKQNYLLLVFLCASTAFGGELVPLEPPGNLTLLDIQEHQVLIEWDPVDSKSLRGVFRGYLVRTWNHAGSQVYAFPAEITRASVEFFPFSKNFITVAARNEKYVGPPSEAISFDAPQIAPNHPFVLNVFLLNGESVLVQWSKPVQPNGVLLGYRIYCSEINDKLPEEKIREVVHEINDPEKFQTKLTGLETGVRYRIGLTAFNCAGESDKIHTETVLERHVPARPFTPKFIYKINYTTPTKEDLCYKSDFDHISVEGEEPGKGGPDYDYYDSIIYNQTRVNKIKASENKPKSPTPEIGYNERCLVACMVLWLPDVRNNPGGHFYLKYKIKGKKDYIVTEPEISEDFTILENFDSCKNYEIVLVAVDGEYQTESGILITPSKMQ